MIRRSNSIYEDRISKEDFLNALKEVYNMSKEERATLGQKGRQHVLNEYGFEKYINSWDQTFTAVHNEMGSWESRINYRSWKLEEIK